jgi:selenocysteine-specific elongation factor
MHVIGTAGHIDHGKSTLVKCLTGIDPDRLAEEKAREMTIDLGFAWLTLPGLPQPVGIVDVPGHRDFIENMLAGVGGIDAALLVIAADEGIMPQTREHLAILDLLGVQNGLIVLTKIDLIQDEEWLDLVSAEIRDAVRNTTLANAEIVPVSSYTGAGIPALLDKLPALLSPLPPHPDYNAPRLPIDRVFTISGFGTVVTGTLMGGALRVGDEIELQPSGLRGRVRGLQSYKHAVETALPGSRVAVNISGVDKRDVARGHVLAHPDSLHPTTLVDVHFRHLPDAARPMKHNAAVKVFAGAAETAGYVRLLSHETLLPGETGWLQLRFDQPLALARGDRFILRYPSPGETIGGGIVVDPHPARRWKRFQPAILHALETQLQGSPAERLAHAAEGNVPLTRGALAKALGINETDLAIDEAVKQGLLHAFTDGTFISTASYNALQRRIADELAAFHIAYPLRIGMSREELRSRLGLKQAALNALLESHQAVVSAGKLLKLAAHEIRFDAAQSARIDTLFEAMNAAPYTPPSFSEAAEIVGEDVLRALIDTEQIVQPQPDLIFTRAAYDEMIAGIFSIIDAEGAITAATLRDRYNTSRKYAIGLLEHLDALGLTRRDGDKRVRGAKRPT